MLAVNMLIKWENGEETNIERILWLDRQSDLAFVIDVEANDFPFAVTISEIEEGISEGFATVLHDDPFLRVVDEDKLSEKERKVRDKAWELIGGIVTLEPHIFYKKERTKYIKLIAEKSGVSVKTIGNYLKKYWRNGKTKNALLPSFYRCGAKGKEKAAGSAKRGRPRQHAEIIGEGINVDEDIKRIFRNAINKYYYSSAKHSLRLTYELMRREYFSEGFKIEDGVKVPILKPAAEIPTFWQFRYWFEKERNIKKEISTRFSTKKYEQEYRPVLGSSTTEAMGPGSIFQVDATLADVYLVSRYNRNWIIGRPIIYAIIDVFSRMVVGIYVGLEGPSWNAAMMAMVNAAGDKVTFCKEYGIEITEEDWPVHHIPEAILADRGELEGKNAENLINGLHVKIMNTPPYRCDWKGIIEQYFKTINLQYKSIVPGTVDPDGRERGDRDYRLDAKLDIYQFTQIIIKCVLYHNNQHYLKNYDRHEMMIADDVECIPRELWRWGIENRSGKLRNVPEDIVKLHLMPSDTATVTPRGIRFKNLYYGSPLMLKERWTEKARMNGTWKLEVCFDPRNMNYIYIKDTDGINFEKCYLLDHQVRYKDKTFDEIQNLLTAEEIKQKKAADDEIQAKAELITEIQHIVQEAQKVAAATKDDGESNAKKKKSIRANRQAEKLANREKEAFELKKETPKGLASVVTLGDNQELQEGEEGQLELLRRKQKEALKKMMDKIKIPGGTIAVPAEYKEQVIPEYRGNPFIEALPPILSAEEAAERLVFYPTYHPQERNLESHYRIHMVQRLFQIFQPLPVHLDLESRISRVLRQGYLARNPLKPQFAQNLKKSDKIIQGVNGVLESNELFRTTASGFSIVGVSGMGKSTAINQVLRMYPQVIVHSRYKETKFSVYQLVWLKLDCPFDGSIKALCIEFFNKVDSMLGTDYYKKFANGRYSVDNMVTAICKIAQNLGLGLLVIDEIQHLNEAKSGGDQRMLNFFVSLVNMLGLPIVLIGTPKALNVLQSQFRQARRGSGQGDMIWERLNKDDTWQLLIDALWGYQWTRKETPLTAEINDTLYEESQGITDIAVKLYAMSQIKAIVSRKEEITPHLIRQVAKENLQLVQPMLQALKKGSLREIAKYDDICTVNIDFAGFFDRSKQTVETEMRLKALQKQRQQEEKEAALSVKEQAIIKLLELNIEAKKAQKALEQVMKTEGEKIDVSELVVKAIQLLTSSVEKTNRKTRHTSRKMDENDIRFIVEEGRKKQMTAYEALKEKGIIKVIDNAIFQMGCSV